MSESWEERSRPARLERRYEFDSYSLLRDFLDRAAELSEKMDYYPNMGFGRDYVNVTIYADEEAGDIIENQREFAKKLDGLQYTSDTDA
jgi:pterin-4a-carbinolamine dehydratase